ncbi:probable RNA-binding protein 46 isoform X2 [Oscarella lobularis]|uniref:probable RNA-binding protein 46 isoform X2 n=1 Tax=Oscarella lobularis TaxID=121494 RepID=UPI00331437D8
MASTTEEQIHQKFVEFGKLEKVKKICDYAFVHYSTREDAVAAKESMDGEEFDGSLLAISWAKPVDKEQRQLAKNFGKTFYDGVPIYPSVNNVSGGGSGGEKVPRSPTSTQAVVPPVNSMYPLQISPFFKRTHLGSYVDRIPSSGNTRPQSCRRYALPPTTLPLSPVAKPFFPPSQGSPPAIPLPPPQSSSFGMSPVMIHAVADSLTSSGVYIKRHSVEVLEDICTRSNWASPQYNLIELNCNSGMTPFYIQKVSIPGLSQHQFQSTKLCSSADEAKALAAENALYHLGLSFLPEGFTVSLPSPHFSSHISSMSASVNDPTKPPPPPLPGAIPPPGGVRQPIGVVYGSPPPPPFFNEFHANRSIYSLSEVYPY